MDINSILVIISTLLAVSEGLALIPALKSNSILTLVINVLKWFKEKLSK
jgi:hypothetical protein